MKQLGYEGVLLQRRDDFGLATFWHTSMFQLIARQAATFHQLAEPHLQVLATQHQSINQSFNESKQRIAGITLFFTIISVIQCRQ